MNRGTALATACWLAVAFAASPAENDIESSRRNAIVRAVEKVAPAVVSVNVLEIQYERVIDPIFQDFFRFFFESPRARTRIRERAVRAVGSGFIFDERGYILTNYHVVQGAHSVSITLPDGRTLDVEFVGGDERSDIAILKSGAKNLPYARLGHSDALLVGEWMIAIGNPFGLLVSDPQPSVSVGVVSANHRRVNRSIGKGERLYQDMIQTDAAINPGNSGGPLVNGLGEVVGINTFIFSQSGGSVGLGFAIPIDRAKKVANEIIRYGRRRDPWPGFTVLGVEEGALVYEIHKSAPAHKAGLRPGDVIIAIDGRAITHPAEVDFAFWGKFVGDQTTLSVKREGRTRTVTFVIKEFRR